jgi:hypothetical protein
MGTQPRNGAEDGGGKEEAKGQRSEELKENQWQPSNAAVG